VGPSGGSWTAASGADYYVWTADWGESGTAYTTSASWGGPNAAPICEIASGSVTVTPYNENGAGPSASDGYSYYNPPPTGTMCP
jgi:hypothetical protein